ncbi:MAG: DNA gyrase subunit A [Firmicutes bacterium ADurb.Bin080]|jgi:DNA gyrase subunit A|nr:DNA gyrase subunit A [Clostridiales bacterium]OQC14876.1 MAG: DNA gyrase subunit A [Firmicutes bacterium ADurb.Bin080]
MDNKSNKNVQNIKEILEKTKIREIKVIDEMQKSFIAYAMAVNVTRAIPDVRDGLKPVHRRILYAMNDLGNTYNNPHKKCARIVGEVLGKYHPHGDSSVYDALVRLAQDFSINEPLVDGHGNFGSVDGDPPAAQRYTEARLTKIAAELLKDLEKETVDYYPNFDDTLMQPTVLPARFPNLLVNGAEGIAVGMATNIPPHNLGEVIDATVALIDNPDLDPEDLVQYIPAPDYPTGGLILGRAAAQQAYKTGRGGVVIRARCEIEEQDGRNYIIVTQLPYQINKANLIKAIAEQVKDKKLNGISNIMDHSDRDGMRIVIELKRDASPKVVLNTLYKQTQLQIKDNMILLALDKGTPKVMTLKEILMAYINHQIDVTVRRTRYLLNKAEERQHIVKGLVIAEANIDEVIAIIKKSRETAEAKARLMERFELSEKQANAILEMKLGRLTSLEVDKLNQELEELNKSIEDYTDIISRPERVLSIIREEILEVRRLYARPRKSEISFDPAAIDYEDLIVKEDVAVTMTYQGYIKRLSLSEYKAQGRGGVGITAHKAKEEDFITSVTICSTHDDVLFFTNRGKVYRLRGYEIPEAPRASKGRASINLLPLIENEKVTAILPIPDERENHAFLLMATKKGLIKKTSVTEFQRIMTSGKIAITLVDDDELISVDVTSGKDEVILASSGGKCIRFDESNIRKTGRTAMGVRSMRIDDSETIVDMAVLKPGFDLITVSELGYGKRSDTDAYRLQGRAGKGIKAGNFSDETGKLIALKQTGEENDIIIISDTGIMIRIRVSDISKIGRSTKGVRLMRLRDGGKVAAVALTPHDENAEFSEVIEEE